MWSYELILHSFKDFQSQGLALLSKCRFESGEARETQLHVTFPNDWRGPSYDAALVRKCEKLQKLYKFEEGTTQVNLPN
jgi:hypothetical protein